MSKNRFTLKPFTVVKLINHALFIYKIKVSCTLSETRATETRNVAWMNLERVFWDYSKFNIHYALFRNRNRLSSSQLLQMSKKFNSVSPKLVAAISASFTAHVWNSKGEPPFPFLNGCSPVEQFVKPSAPGGRIPCLISSSGWKFCTQCTQMVSFQASFTALIIDTTSI